jgi:hypothetical protein
MAPNAEFGLDLRGLWFDTFILLYVDYSFEF